MSHLLVVFSGATIFSKIDLRGAYNLLQIKEGDKYLTAFRTLYGSFEYLVMPFGLTNAPSLFQSFLNSIFSDVIDEYCKVFLDNILVFSRTLEEHVRHVSSVLERLRTHHLYAKASKCSFHTDYVKYLGFVISPSGISMDQKKVQHILDWPEPRNLTGVQSFLGFANFYRRFIKGHSKQTVSLPNATRKDTLFLFTEQAGKEFEDLKKAFTSAPILAHFDVAALTNVKTDASDYALSACISQITDGLLHPIAFDSRKLIAAKLNYKIHNKELLAIVWAVQKW